MEKDIFKRAGMLLASTAVCYGVVFGGLSLNGLQYVRPTAENWTLLAYMQPAARIEQQKQTRVISDEKEWSGAISGSPATMRRTARSGR